MEQTNSKHCKQQPGAAAGKICGTFKTTMKPLSETLTELSISSAFPINIKDANGNQTYYETNDGYWCKSEYDANGNRTYFENSDGERAGTPKSAKTCEGKVVEIDGIKYELKAL